MWIFNHLFTFAIVKYHKCKLMILSSLPYFLICYTTKNANRWESHILKILRDCTEIFNSENRTYFAKIFILLCPLLKIVVHLHRKPAPRDKSNSLRSWKVTSWRWCASAWKVIHYVHDSHYVRSYSFHSWNSRKAWNSTFGAWNPSTLKQARRANHSARLIISAKLS